MRKNKEHQKEFFVLKFFLIIFCVKNHFLFKPKIISVKKTKLSFPFLRKRPQNEDKRHDFS